MGSAVGTSPGRVVETDAKGNILHQWPEDVDGLLNILGEQFSPHGLSVDWDNNVFLTSDYVVPLSILKPTAGIVRADTLRLWKLDTREILSTITIPEGAGIQDVKFIPGNKESAALATAVGLGEVWIIYPFRKNADGTQGVAEKLFYLGKKAEKSTAIYSDISPDGKWAYFTITVGNHVAALDISDLDNVKRLDDENEVQPIIGPHYVKLSPDRKNLLVTGYFVQAGDVRPCPCTQSIMKLPLTCHRSPSSTRLPTSRPTGSTLPTMAPSASTALLTLKTSLALPAAVL